MKVTGIVRRIDDLGRIAIPREIRRVMNIHEGDPIEISTDSKDTICLRKYEINLCGAVDSLKDQIEACCDYLTYDTLAKIENLLGEVRELVKGEE